MNYRNYLVKDFTTDEFFIRWVLRDDPETDKFWTDWILKNPDKAAEVEEAKTIIKQLHSPLHVMPEDKVNHLLSTIQNIIAKDSIRIEKKPKLFSQNFLKYAAAISFLLISSFIIIYYFNISSPQIVATSYGIVKNVDLPDGSKVILNANSSIRYNKKFISNNVREVWVEGEAYFNVKKVKKETPVKFIVHLKKARIEVLGTSFNVNDRRGKTKVVLETGSVKLFHEIKDIEPILLKPGEMVELNGEVANKKLVKPENFSSWKNSMMIFDNQSLAEIALTIEDIYGYNVEFEDHKLKDLRFKGAFPSKNLDVLLFSFKKVYNIEIEKTDDKLIFKAY